MANIVYHQVSSNNWLKQEFADQCSEKIFIRGECQGIKGHQGHHWCYSPSGNYCWSSEKKDLKPHEAACGSTPPGHSDYINPVGKYDDYYLRHNETTEVKDEGLVDKLENGEDMGEGVSTTRPLSQEEVKELKDDGILGADEFWELDSDSDD